LAVYTIYHTTTEIFSHHIDIVTPSFTHNENSIHESDGYADCYMSYISDCYRQDEEPVTISELRKKNAVKNLHLTPIGLMLAKRIQDISNTKPLLHVLFDSGSDNTFISRSVLPKGASSKTTDKLLKVHTMNG
jgi:hypothetical protein